MDNKTIRLINLNLLRMECDPQTWAELERRTGVKQNYISQVRGKGKHVRNIGDSVARRLEVGMGKPKGWMDNVHPANGARPEGREANVSEIIRSIPGLTEEEADLIEKILTGIRSSAERG